MKSNALPFWEMNVNPITMKQASIVIPDKIPVETITEKHLGEIPDDLITHREASELIGVGIRKIKNYASSMGEFSINSDHGLLYKKETIEDIKNMIIAEAERKEKLNSAEGYISNKELMEMFNVNAFKSWKIAKDHNLVKRSFNRNVAYYERDKAIEIFSKYKK